MATFGDLVNDAIDESKVSLDPLDSSNFLSPPRTVMYNRFKKWVNMAYKELFRKRNDWYFRKERTSFSIWSRIHLSGIAVGYTPTVGDVLAGASSGVQFTVMALHSFEDVEQDPTTERTLSIDVLDGYNISNFILREQFNVVSSSQPGNVGLLSIGYLKGVGSYDFRSIVTNLESIDMDSVRIHHTPVNAVTDSLSYNANSYPVVPVMWNNWNNVYQDRVWNGEIPQYITVNPKGTYDLFPQPDNEVILSFDFVRKTPKMVNFTDTPDGLPEEDHDYLMWRAVQEYADFDGVSKLYLRSTKHVEEYLYIMERDRMPPVRFEESRFNSGSRSWWW